MSSPKVSICIPAYKRPELMRACLQSISEQDFTDYEVVITDDSISDDVGIVVSEFKQKIKNLRYYKNKERKGSPENWNECIGKATGEYIKIIHCDDSFSGVASLRKYVSALDANPGVDFAFSSSHACDEGGRIIWTHRPTEAQVEELSKNPDSLYGSNIVGAPSVTIHRRSAIRYDKNLKWLVDFDYYMMLLKSNPKFVFIEEPLVSISLEGADKVTNECVGNKCVEFREYLYVYAKATRGGIKIKKSNFLRILWSIIKRYNIQSVKDVSSCSLLNKIPYEVRILMFIQKVLKNISVINRIRSSEYKKRLKDTFLYELYNHIFNRGNIWKPKVSYSQCGEDLIISFLFSWMKIEKPTYLDIGANEPVKFSNTYYFYKRGFRGVLVEPDPKLCKEIASKRVGDICLNVGIGFSENETTEDFYVMSTNTLNTFSKKEALRYSEYADKEIKEIKKIKLVSVNSVIKNNFSKTPNFVSIDTEGNDLKILESMNWGLYRPEVFCIETLTYTEDNTARKISEISDFMEKMGYFVYADTYINTIFVDKMAWKKR